MRSPAHCTPCNAFVGAGFYPARGRGRAPPLRTTRYTFFGAGVLDGPTGFFRTRQGTRALPYKALRYRGRADRVVRPYKPFRRAGCPHPAAGLAPHFLQKPCHCEPVTDSLVWQSVLLVLGTEVLRIPTTSLRTGLGMTRKFFRLLLLLWQSVPPPPKMLFPSRKKGPRHPAEPLFKPIQFIRNPHCPPCAGAAPHPGCCSLP